MRIEDFRVRPDLGATTPEPSLEDIIFQYYEPHYSTSEANDLTDRYIAKMLDGE